MVRARWGAHWTPSCVRAGHLHHCHLRDSGGPRCRDLHRNSPREPWGFPSFLQSLILNHPRFHSFLIAKAPATSQERLQPVGESSRDPGAGCPAGTHILNSNTACRGISQGPHSPTGQKRPQTKTGKKGPGGGGVRGGRTEETRVDK